VVGDVKKKASRLFDETQKISETRFEYRERLSLQALHGQSEHVVLLTVSKPDGDAHLENMESLSLHVPVVVLTDSDDETLAVRALRMGAQDCLLLRQLDPRNLVRSLRHAEERHRRLMELKQAHQREQYLATHDGLTGLPNRRLYFDRLSNAMAFASRYGEVVAVLFLDLDKLKYINDEMGHEAGDRLLQAVAKRFKQSVRKSDTVARHGGDEFAFILRRVTGRFQLSKVVEKIQECLSRPLLLDGHEVRVTASIGISVYSRDGETARELVQKADEAMYASKKMGGDSYEFWRSGIGHEGPLQPAFTAVSPNPTYLTAAEGHQHG
jgi:diguanylate cyclase (GGDEF)-like protein